MSRDALAELEGRAVEVLKRHPAGLPEETVDARIARWGPIAVETVLRDLLALLISERASRPAAEAASEEALRERLRMALERAERAEDNFRERDGQAWRHAKRANEAERLLALALSTGREMVAERDAEPAAPLSPPPTRRRSRDGR